MRKMIVGFFAIIFVAVSAQAAAISWATGTVNTLPVNSGSTYAMDWQGQAVSFYLVTAGYNLTTIIDGLKNNDLTVLTGLTKDLSAALGTKGASGTGLKTDFAVNATVYGFALVFDSGYSVSKGTVDFAISTVKSATIPAVGDGIMNFGGTVGFTTYDAVPEPTSMALLALGVAAIGLRRRFKK